MLDALYEPFNRLGVADVSVQGTGLGLTITRLVAAMHGDMGAESAGVGSKILGRASQDARKPRTKTRISAPSSRNQGLRSRGNPRGIRRSWSTATAPPHGTIDQDAAYRHRRKRLSPNPGRATTGNLSPGPHGAKSQNKEAACGTPQAATLRSTAWGLGC